MKKIPQGYKKDKNRIIPQDWDFVKIDTILEKVGTKVDVERQELYQQIGIRSHGKGLFYKEHVTGEELGNKSVFWLERDCFIVNIVFAWEQAIGRTTEKEVGMICSHRFPMYRPKEERVDIDYLVYLFKTPYGKKVLELASPGGAGRNKTLGQKEFMNSEILIPNSIEEQDKIVKIISTWDLAIEKQEQLIKKKKDFKKELMNQLLQSKSNIHKEEKWKEVELGDICIIKTGKLDANEMTENGAYNFFTCAKEVFKIDKYAFDTEALLISGNGANVGYIHYYKGKFNAYQRTYVLDDFKEDISFIKFTLEKNLSARINKEKNSGNTPYIVLSTLSKMKIEVPTKDTQRYISRLLKTVDQEIELLEKELEVLKLQKKGLMQRLLTGEVRVKI